MALTGRVNASIYRKDQYDLKSNIGAPATMGVPQSFPTNLCNFYPAPSGTTANGVTMVTIIEELPSGLYNNGMSHKYYTADTITTLNTNGS